MTDLGTWTSVVLTLALLVVAYIAYQRRYKRTRLEYAVVSNARVVPAQLSSNLHVTYEGHQVPDASVAIIRLVNTGERAILAAEFSSSLRVRLVGATAVVAALASNTRPRDLNPALTLEGNSVAIAPLLVNPADMIQLQLLVSGLATAVSVEARIADVPTVRQRSLPYNPGSGPEGEVTAQDKVVWYGMAAVVAALLIYSIVTTRITPVAKTPLVVAAVLVALAIPRYFLFLDKRRSLWRL